MNDSAEMDMTPMIDIVFNLLIFFMIITDLTQKDIVELTLPLASQAQEDKGKEEDDRLILNVDKDGQIKYRGEPRSLEELGTILKDQIRLYEIKMKDQDKEGKIDVGGGIMASKLYVLLRADKETPWQHVQWLMTVMAEQKLYKLQFATKRYIDSDYDPEEAKMLDGKRQGETGS